MIYQVVLGQGGSALFPLFVGLLAQAKTIRVSRSLCVSRTASLHLQVFPPVILAMMGSMTCVWFFMPNAQKKRE